MAHILVVDDVDVVRLVISKILKRNGHTVTEAGGGAAALDAITRRIPDAVVTDLWMPTIDGLHLIETIKARHPAVAIIAMSGGSPQHSQQELAGQGAAGRSGTASHEADRQGRTGYRSQTCARRGQNHSRSTGVRTMVTLIEENRNDLLARWGEILRASYAGAARRNPADLNMLGNVMDRLVEAFKHAASLVISDPAFRELSRYMAEVSSTLAREGYLPE